MYKQYRVGVVIPAYNVEGFIRETVEELPAFVDRIYVVDDGSVDNTALVVRSLGENGRLRLIQHPQNKGPGAATSSGYKAAMADGIDIIVKSDGDGQTPLEYLEDILIPIAQGDADYTKGDRLSNSGYSNGMPKFRRVGNFLLTWLTRIASGYWRVNDPQNGFTGISRCALEKIEVGTIYPYYGYLNDMLVRLNICDCRVQDIPMPAKYGNEKSSIKYRRYIPKMSALLLRKFLWRLRRKYARI